MGEGTLAHIRPDWIFSELIRIIAPQTGLSTLAVCCQSPTFEERAYSRIEMDWDGIRAMLPDIMFWHPFQLRGLSGV